MKLPGSTILISSGDSEIYPTVRSIKAPALGIRPQNRPAIRNSPAMAVFALLALANSQAQDGDGERLFRQRCTSCHSLQAGQNRTGPSLAEVNGRTAGSVEDARYSSALRNSKLAWTEDTLDRYLASPREFVPGTTMSVAIPNEAERRALINFLIAR
jgi:cytochrome c